jgi:hypothetical protein
VTSQGGFRAAFFICRLTANRFTATRIGDNVLLSLGFGNKTVPYDVYRVEENVMQTRLGNFWHESRAYLKTGWLITAGLIALYLGAIAPLENARSNSMQKATGLSAVATERRSFSLRSPKRLRVSGSVMGGVIGGVPGGVPEQAMMAVNATAPAAGSEDRKLVRTGAMDLVVKNPGESAEKIRQLADPDGRLSPEFPGDWKLQFYECLCNDPRTGSPS